MSAGPKPSLTIILVTISTFTTLGFALLTLGLHVYPYRVVEARGIAINTPTVRAGGTMSYTIDYCKYRDVPAMVLREYIALSDGAVYQAPSVLSNLETGCHQTKLTVRVPQLEPGRYTMRVTRMYQVNPFQRQQFALQTEPFMIEGAMLSLPTLPPQ